MQQSKAQNWVRCAALAAIGTFAVIGHARAADPGHAAPARVETWTGFSAGIGGGVGTLNADMKSQAARTDTIGLCLIDCDVLSFDLLDINQNYASSLSDLGDTGGFFTVQGAYDYQFASRWVAGGFVDADWSNIGGHSKQSSSSSLTLLPGGSIPDEVDIDDDLAAALNSISGFNVPLGKATIDSKVSTDWSVSVGGRFGWLATPSTLLYVLGAYTHQELSDARVNVRIADPLGPLSEIGLDINSPTNLRVKLPELARRLQPRRRQRGQDRRSLDAQARISLDPSARQLGQGFEQRQSMLHRHWAGRHLPRRQQHGLGRSRPRRADGSRRSHLSFLVGRQRLRRLSRQACRPKTLADIDFKAPASSGAFLLPTWRRRFWSDSPTFPGKMNGKT